MERIINKIISSFKKKYFLITFIFVMIIIVMSGSYSYWSKESGWQKASELTYNTLSYSFTINSVATNTITSTANSGTVYYDVAITNLNNINTKYLLVYNSSAAGLSFDVSSVSKNNSSGIVGAYEAGAGTGKTRIVRIAVTNNTANPSTITLNVLGGYTWNSESAISIPNNYYAITTQKVETTYNYGLTLAQEVSQILSCTPTASSPCLYTGNANNYVSYGGKTWRILGSYIVSGETVLKLILDDYSTNSVTYSNTAGELSSFYSSLTDTSLVRTASPFVCTGTTTVSCTGSTSFGLLSKTEYDLIGGANSYLYTKPSKPYWTNTQSSSGIYYIGKNRGIETLSETSTAYVKPVIYLKAETVRNLNTKGTLSDPFQIKLGYYLTVTANSGTTKFLSGYYGPGYTYTDNAPTRTNYVFRDYVPTGTGTSINSYTLTMGTENSTLTLRWWALYSIAYNCNGGSGSMTNSSHVEGTSKNLNINNCAKITEGAAGAVYTFLGWDTSSSASSPTYTNGASVLSLTSVGGSTVTLYAVWGSSIFSYSQSYYVTNEGSGNWNIQYRTGSIANNLVVSSSVLVDFYILSGGAGGSGGVGAYRGGGGGGSGYATTVLNYTISAGTYSLVIGNGGAGSAANSYLGGGEGYSSSLFGYAPSGGHGSSGDHRNGGNGASGGGRGTYASGYPKPGGGGSDGSDGLYGTGWGSVGVGQHTTTRSFAEAGGILLAGGGGGGGYASSGSANGAAGAGGGGLGGWWGVGGDATVNTGGGGGGGGAEKNGGAGGSGLIIIRNKR